MELITKKHEEITSNQRVDLAAYCRINEKHLYFSAGACINFGLVPGLFIHFQNDEQKWYLYGTTDTDGFELIARPGKNSAIICDVSLLKLMMKRTGVSVGSKFPIQKINAKLNGSQLLEINFNKPIED